MSDNIIVVKQAPFMTFEQLPDRCLRIAQRMVHLTSAGIVAHTIHTRDENKHLYGKFFMWMKREDTYSPASETFCLTIKDVSYRRVRLPEIAMCIEYTALSYFLMHDIALSNRLKLHSRMMSSGLFGTAEVKQWQIEDVTV